MGISLGKSPSLLVEKSYFSLLAMRNFPPYWHREKWTFLPYWPTKSFLLRWHTKKWAILEKFFLGNLFFFLIGLGKIFSTLTYEKVSYFEEILLGIFFPYWPKLVFPLCWPREHFLLVSLRKLLLIVSLGNLFFFIGLGKFSSLLAWIRKVFFLLLALEIFFFVGLEKFSCFFPIWK